MFLDLSSSLLACAFIYFPALRGRSRIKAAQSRGKSREEWQRLKEHVAERLACGAL